LNLGKMRKQSLIVYAVLILATIITGCGSVKQAKRDLLYLKDGQLDTLPNLQVPIKETVIQPDDILSIVVYSDNPEATALYNQASGANSSKVTTDPTTAVKTAGYLVDHQGFIRFQGVGMLKVAGMTRLQLMDTLTNRMLPYLTHPYVDVRFLNTKVTILGEVQKPGVFTLPNEKLSILELIGMAGDVTIYGKKDNILVIREQNGKREFGRLDLRKADVFQSPYFYLQKNDLVVIEANNKKPTATEQDNLRKLTMVTSFATLVSTFAILVSIFK
jgi:polysaccharide export outer membrane protein